NYCGIDPSGTTAAPNAIAGISLRNAATANQIGGVSAADRNVVSGNTEVGVYITDPGTTGNTVYGNFIGTDKTGTSAVPNLGQGVVVSHTASGNYIGNSI